MAKKNTEKDLVEKFFKEVGLDTDSFLSNDLSELPDFGTLLDIGKSAKKIKECIEKDSTIGLYGDYDADGTTSIALFYWFLQFHCGHNKIKTYQPNRFIDGYGLHKSSIETAIGDGVELLVTFDCGIMNQESAQYAKECNLDLIITDHHNDGGQELPVAYSVVNPKRQDQKGHEHLKELAGVGVSFSLALEVRKELSLKKSAYELLQFVAIGTIGDLVNINPSNAKMVRHGLSQFKSSSIPAINLLGYLAPKNGLNSEYIGFRVAPMINSKGRIGDPEDALRFLIAKDGDEAQKQYKKINDSNEERKKIQAKGRKKAMDIIESKEFCTPEKSGVMVVYSEEFGQGVVGLIASSIMRKFKKPAICISKNDDGLLKGSVRSFGDFDIYNFLSDLNFPFVSFGGHSKAAGLALKEDDLEKFIKTVAESSSGVVVKEERRPVIKASPNLVNWSLLKEICRFEPYGQGHEKPLVGIDVEVTRAHLMKNRHLSITTKNGLKIVMFNCFDCAREDFIESILCGEKSTVYVEAKVSSSEYMGKVQLSIFAESIGC